MVGSLDEIYEAIQKDLEIALVSALQEGVDIAKNYISEMYNSYEPSFYERTWALFDSLKADYDGLTGKIFIRSGYHPKSNWKDRNKTYSGVFKWFASGNAYGRNGEKYDMINYTEEQLIVFGKALEKIKEYMISQGWDFE